MIRRLLPLLLLLLSAMVMHAQVGEPRRDLAVGFHGGYVFNKIDFQPSIPQTMHGGITMGGIVRYTCEKYFSLLCGIQGELNFTQLGWTEDITTSTDTYSRNINYFQLPLLAYLALGKELGGPKGYLVIGPQLGFAISDSDTRTGEWSEETLYRRPNHVVEQYDMPIQKKFEYGITGGLGFEMSTKRGLRFQLEGRYYFGLSDIFNNSKKDPFGRSASSGIYVRGAVLFDVIKTKQ